MENNKIWMDGKLLDWDKCSLHATSYSLHYGVAAFEGIRIYETENGAALFRLKDHIKRLFDSAGAFGMKIPFTKEEIINASKEVIKANKAKQGYVRPIVFYSGTELYVHADKNKVSVAIALLPWKKYLGADAVKVMPSSYIRLHPKSLPMSAKISGHYANSILAIREAKKNGYDEALLLDFEGNIAEGGAENFFIVKNNILITPPLGNILPGITRDSIIELAKSLGIKVEEKKFKLSEAENADEAFFTGTGAEITPIIQIGKKIIAEGKIGQMTKKLQESYKEIVSGNNVKFQDWLEYL